MSKRIFYGWWIVLACSLVVLYVGGVIHFGFTAFFKPIRDEFGWSYTQISFAVSLRGIEMGIFAPLAGLLVDHFGPRKLILLGTIIVGFGLILLSHTQSLVMFYGSFLLVAFGMSGCSNVVANTAVANWFRRKVGIALGVFGSGIGAGGVVVLLVVYLIDLYQWRTTLVILGLGMWALGIPLSFVVRDRPEHYGYLPDGEALSPSVKALKVHDKGMEIGFREALKKRSLLYLSTAEFMRHMALSAVLLHVMPYLGSVGVPRPTAGLVAGAIPLIGIIGRFGFGWLADLFDKRHLLAVTYGFLSLGMLAFAYANVRWLILPFLFFFSLGHGGSMVVRGAIVREYFGRDSFGKMLGIIMGCGAVGGIIGPTVAGWVFDTLGSYQPIWPIFCGLICLTTVLIFRIKRAP